MTLKEFKARHGDLLLDEVKWDEIPAIATGAALFYISLSNKNGPKDDKTVLWAGHVLTSGMYWSNTELMVLRLTNNVNTKLDTVTAKQLGPDGRGILFKTVPIPESDPRSRNYHNRWEQEVD